MRSFLYVPAHRRRPLEKALSGATGADSVIVDLEDAVPFEERAAAEENLTQAVQDPGGPPALCRIRVGKEERAADLAVIPTWFDGVLLAKAQASDDLRRVAETVSRRGQRLGIWLLIESAEGVENLRMLLASDVPVAGVMFGAGDMRADLGLWDDDDDRLVDHIRSQIVVACVAAHVQHIVDTPEPDLEPGARFAARIRSARGLGFTAKAAIHPRQLAAIDAAFRPSAQRLAWARKVLAAGDGASRVDGVMIDEATKRVARRLTASAADNGKRE